MTSTHANMACQEVSDRLIVARYTDPQIGSTTHWAKMRHIHRVNQQHIRAFIPLGVSTITQQVCRTYVVEWLDVRSTFKRAGSNDTALLRINLRVSRARFTGRPRGVTNTQNHRGSVFQARIWTRGFGVARYSISLDGTLALSNQAAELEYSGTLERNLHTQLWPK